ncbi:MAG: hypothetical protein U0797_31275, partial [Gemmataceae bacterium]
MSTQPDRDSPKAVPRTGPVLVRGAFSLGPLVFLLCCGQVLVGVGVYDRALRPWDRTSFQYMASAGAFWTALAAGTLLGQLWRRRWVEPTPTGFILTDRGRSRTFDDEDVVGVTHSFRERSVPDIRHRVRLEVRGGRPVVIAYSVPQGQADPLADLWARVVTGLVRRVRAGLGEGASLAGRHWRLDKDGLLYRGEVFPLRSVTKVGYYSGRLCLWKGEDERPF